MKLSLLGTSIDFFEEARVDSPALSCTFENIKDLYSPADLQKMAQDVKNGGAIPEGMTNAMAACAHLR